MNEKKLAFKVNASIKNIIGKQLIYSDNVAIIELIKNSKDAAATNTNIRFIDENDLVKGKIIISDNGKGMCYDDIVNKWLNIAYSEKLNNKDGTVYAGNKGVGRFSCDRLGATLTLYTKSSNGDYCKLIIDWSSFENRAIDEEVKDIQVDFVELSESDFIAELSSYQVSPFKTTGSVLVIDRLREAWDTNKLKQLISELEKFSPSLEDTFSITIFSNNTDKNLIKKLNARINNNILDKVAFKTTYIKSSIDGNGAYINTSLFYQGTEIYRYKVKNPYPNLKNVKTEIHYLDIIARAYFTKTIGVRAIEYGSIFLFYNNFRISPYGNPHNDWLGRDQRKAQGRSRYLGTRELFGRVDIIDKGDVFEVLSNREGLANNTAFRELIAHDKEYKASIEASHASERNQSYGYIENIIRQLETFVVEALEWNKFVNLIDPDSKKVISEKDLLKYPDRYKMKEISSEKVKITVERLLKSNWSIKTIHLNVDAIKNISEVANQKHRDYLNDFSQKIGSKSLSELTNSEMSTVAEIINKERDRTENALKAKQESDHKRLIAEKSEKKKSKKLQETERSVAQLNSINSFLKKTANQDIDDLLISMHSILVNNSTIKTCIIRSLQDLEISDKIRDLLVIISEANQKNYNIAKFATLYNFTDKQNRINGELGTFIDAYIAEIKNLTYNKRISIINKIDTRLSINIDFIPLEIMMMVENIIENSKKAKASNITISNRLENDGVVFVFADDGHGVSNERYVNCIDLIFEKGETTTRGSGLGLYQVEKTVKKLDGKVLVTNYTNGFTLELHLS